MLEGLSGWVRNLPNGSVEVVAEGEREALERFERALARGPAMARVDAVDTSDESPSGRGGAFTVKH